MTDSDVKCQKLTRGRHIAQAFITAPPDLEWTKYKGKIVSMLILIGSVLQLTAGFFVFGVEQIRFFDFLFHNIVKKLAILGKYDVSCFCQF